MTRHLGSLVFCGRRRDASKHLVAILLLQNIVSSVCSEHNIASRRQTDNKMAMDTT